jgi:hypothetical protein
VIPLQMLLACLLGWLEAQQRDVIAFLREENRVLKAQLGSRRLRLTSAALNRLSPTAPVSASNTRRSSALRGRARCSSAARIRRNSATTCSRSRSVVDLFDSSKTSEIPKNCVSVPVRYEPARWPTFHCAYRTLDLASRKPNWSYAPGAFGRPNA